MKEKFLELIKQVKELGITETLQETSSPEEFKEVWNEYWEGNTELRDRIITWAAVFQYSGSKAIYIKGEEIQNPFEIIAIIKVIDNQDVSEYEIFEDPCDLMEALNRNESQFAIRISEVIKECLVCDIDAEDIFLEGR